MPQLASVFIWLGISAFCFYLRRHVKGRQAEGRKLVGIGALLIAAVLAVPQVEGSLTAGDVIAAIGTFLAVLFIGWGMYLALPFGASARQEDAGEDEGEAEDQGDAEDTGPTEDQGMV